MQYSRKEVKKAIKKLEDAEHEMLVMLATLGDQLSENDLKFLVKEILNTANYRSRYIEVLKELDRREGE